MIMEENMNKVFFIFMIIGVFFLIIGSIFNWNYIFMFFIYCVILISLVNYIRCFIESFSVVVGLIVGGLFNVMFGNVVEIIILFFVLSKGLNIIVIFFIIGVVFVNLFFVSGILMIVGGI